MHLRDYVSLKKNSKHRKKKYDECKVINIVANESFEIMLKVAKWGIQNNNYYSMKGYYSLKIILVSNATIYFLFSVLKIYGRCTFSK